MGGIGKEEKGAFLGIDFIQYTYLLFVSIICVDLKLINYRVDDVTYANALNYKS